MRLLLLFIFPLFLFSKELSYFEYQALVQSNTSIRAKHFVGNTPIRIVCNIDNIGSPVQMNYASVMLVRCSAPDKTHLLLHYPASSFGYLLSKNIGDSLEAVCTADAPDLDDFYDCRSVSVSVRSEPKIVIGELRDRKK